jgi:hypothetical protein
MDGPKRKPQLKEISYTVPCLGRKTPFNAGGVTRAVCPLPSIGKVGPNFCFDSLLWLLREKDLLVAKVVQLLAGDVATVFCLVPNIIYWFGFATAPFIVPVFTI